MTISMAVPVVALAFEGTSVSSGTFSPALRLITQISLAGTSVSNGTCVLTQSDVPGAFADFALVPYVPIYGDPAFSHVTSAVYRAGGTTDTVGQWRRLSLTMIAPNADYAPGPLGRIYGVFDQARVGVQSANMAVGETHQLAYIQFEKTPPGLDTDTSQFGSNLFTLEQASYEGRMLYEPVGGAGETNYMTFSRTTERPSCGAYSGKFVYQSPPPTNSYTAVQNFGSYPNLSARRQTYADVKYRAFTTDDALPGTNPSTNVGGTPIAAPATLTLRPLQAALVRVEPGITYQAQISAATEVAGQTFQCAILRYDANFNQIGTPVTGTAVTTAGGFKWQQAAAQLLMEDTAVWAAVVPRITSGGASRFVFYTDEHRIWVPSTLATKKAGASPARAWQPPRQLILKLRATRVNYVKNPSFQNSVWGWTHVKDASVTSSLTLLTAGGVVGNGARYQMDASPAATLINGLSPRTGVTTVTGQNALVERLRPSTVYTASIYVRPIARAVPVTLWAHTGDTLVRGTSTPIFDTTGNTTWFRLAVTFKTNSTFGGSGSFTVGYAAEDVATIYRGAPPDSNAAIWEPVDGDPAAYPPFDQTWPYIIDDRVSYNGLVWRAIVNNGPFASIGPFIFYMDQFLVEAADRVAPFFDGNQPSGDYMWEGAPGDSRSHYYRGKRVNQYRLDQIIQRQLGVGASYRVVYASAP
ncbi:hypothetical protein [Streptomyces sp. NBC_01760]|uniref:hypothetical protein n=1 Tax=Streptomyces sp. NBC_01760 TaxID=2975931 RepID=UPI002DD8E7B0|nr:hypothetical protein [Streptomyces sp. NBC_01760]WSC72153.1 hypothetical protein OG807_28805 [Streptomyces sp. NBC_01760]